MIGIWNSYARGEVYSTLTSLLNRFLKHGISMHIALGNTDFVVDSHDDLMNAFVRCEKEAGLKSLLDELERGVKLSGQDPVTSHKNTVILLMHFPEDRGESKRRVFKDMIIEEIKAEGVLFSEKYFKHPKTKLVSSPIERALKKMFGFQFEYKILVESTQWSGKR